ncbi:MAG: CDP-glycerol:glycerophosphate glycerophosphotransferase [Anaerocolumna sp.]
MSTIKYSINIYLSDDMQLELCLESIFHANRKMRNNLEVVLLDNSSDPETKAIIEKFSALYKMNIKRKDCLGLSCLESYNIGKEISASEYVSFITANVVYSKNAIKEMDRFINKNDCKIVTFVPSYSEINGSVKKKLKFGHYDMVIDLEEDIYQLSMFFHGYFFNVSVIQSIRFKNDVIHNGEELFLLDALKVERKYGIISNEIYTYDSLEIDYYNFPDQYYKTWYTEHIQTVIIPVLEKAQSRLVQFAMLYLLMIKFACNMNDRHKAILNQGEFEDFMSSMKDALLLIDDDIIAQYDIPNKLVLPRFMGLNLLRVKYGNNELTTDIIEVINSKTQEQELVGTYNKTIIESFQNVSAYIKAINYMDEGLVIDGEVSNVYFLDYDKIKVTVHINGSEITATRNYIYSLVKYFGNSVRRGYTFQIKIPVSVFDKKIRFKFTLHYDEYAIAMPLSFKNIQARLYENFAYSYWCFDKFILSYKPKTDELIISSKNIMKIIGHEVSFNINFLVRGDSLARALKSTVLRMLYWITKPYFNNKQVWLTFDQLFKGGDNGEYFYRYVSERKDKGNIKIYYVLNKTAPEYVCLQSKYQTVLKFNSIKHKLVSLHADVVFATRVDVKLYCGYWSATEKYIRDLFNAEITCLQHGLTIQRIAQYQNRLFDNTKLYFCVSPFEIENLLNPVYGYDGKELILTGAPRFDGLMNNDQRYILISPTWRRNVTAGTNKKGNMHEYSVNFKHTEYYKIYNTLINDKRLIEASQKYGYRIKYLVHPILSPQIKDFEVNDYVDIIGGAGDVSYEKMLTEASLMVTDYSGIQFDFASMRKPIVYYHSDSLPAQYEAGGLQYDTMGFGPVCINNDDVVKQLCEHMEENCSLRDVYRNRIDTFFSYSDTNNCQRVYEAAIKYCSKRTKEDHMNLISNDK